MLLSDLDVYASTKQTEGRALGHGICLWHLCQCGGLGEAIRSESLRVSESHRPAEIEFTVTSDIS